MTRRLVRFAVWTMSAVLLTGCMPKLTIEKLKAMIPERPVELDKLNAFAGHWETEAETRITGLDEVLKTTASGDGKWEGDGWFLVSRGSFTMGELGEMQGLETWTYDTHSKIYRSTWVDSTGSTGTGTSWHDEKSDTWHFRGTIHGPCGKTSGKGTAKFIDENTMEWTWTEYAGLMKTMEMTGTSRRR